MKYLGKNLSFSLVLYGICLGLVGLYTIIVDLLGHSFWPETASGSLIIDEHNKIRGSYLMAQDLSGEQYFRARPYIEYDPDCDVALYNPDLKSRLSSMYDAKIHPYDISMLTPSSSSHDPFITRREAISQARIIAKARRVHIEKIYKLIDDNTLFSQAPFFELDIVNTSILNVSLDHSKRGHLGKF